MLRFLIRRCLLNKSRRNCGVLCEMLISHCGWRFFLVKAVWKNDFDSIEREILGSNCKSGNRVRRHLWWLKQIWFRKVKKCQLMITNCSFGQLTVPMLKRWISNMIVSSWMLIKVWYLMLLIDVILSSLSQKY